MRILIACEFSGIVRDAFIRKGHKAVSCDVLETERPGPHIQDDVTLHLRGWDMIIAFPPCTYLCNSGVRWLHEQEGRFEEMMKAAHFFRQLLYAPADKVVVENPTMHKYALKIVGRKPDQYVQPWQFGEDASKRTGLWLRGLPQLQPTNIIKKKRYANQTVSGQNNLGPSRNRWKDRSRTYEGIANAMAEQWG